MTSIEFGKLCRQYNIKYRDLFGYIPCPSDYICSQEAFVQALILSIEKNRKINEFIEKRSPMDLSDSNKIY